MCLWAGERSPSRARHVTRLYTQDTFLVILCIKFHLPQVWGYDEGHCHFVGVGHSGAIARVAITPDKSRAVTVGTEGGIFIWDLPRLPTVA